MYTDFESQITVENLYIYNISWQDKSLWYERFEIQLMEVCHCGSSAALIWFLSLNFAFCSVVIQVC